MFAAMTDAGLRAAVYAAVYRPETVCHVPLAAFRARFGDPNCAQWSRLFDFYGITKTGAVLALGQDEHRVGRLPRRRRTTAAIYANAVA